MGGGEGSPTGIVGVTTGGERADCLAGTHPMTGGGQGGVVGVARVGTKSGAAFKQMLSSLAVRRDGGGCLLHQNDMLGRGAGWPTGHTKDSATEINFSQPNKQHSRLPGAIWLGSISIQHSPCA